MDIRQLKYFTEIYRYRNFSNAAEACFITPQGISMAILRLEEELACKLFTRTAKGLKPTPHAEYLYPRAQQILTLMDECDTYFKKGVGKEVFFPVMFALGTIEEFAGIPIARFKEQYPNIHLDIQETYDVICDASVENMAVEIALTVGPVDESKFNKILLFSSQHALVVHKDHPYANRKSISVQELINVPVAVMRDTTKTFRVFRDACQKVGFEPRVSVFADNILLVYYLAEMNQAVGISAIPLAKRLARPNLRMIPFSDPVFEWNIYLIKLKNAKLSTEARAFENVLFQYRKEMMPYMHDR